MMAAAERRTSGVRGVKVLDLSARTVAGMLGCHPRRVKRMAAAGAFPGAYRLDDRGEWRIPEASVLAMRAERARRVAVLLCAAALVKVSRPDQT